MAADGVVYFAVDASSREISVPSDQRILGVMNDSQTRRVGFAVPVSNDDIDLSGYKIYINYQTAAGNTGRYLVDDATVEDTNIKFTWLVDRAVYEKDGTVFFSVCMRKFDSDGTTITNEFHSAKGSMAVLPVIESASSYTVEDVTDTAAELEQLIADCKAATTAANEAAAAVNTAMTAEY